MLRLREINSKLWLQNVHTFSNTSPDRFLISSQTHFLQSYHCFAALSATPRPSELKMFWDYDTRNMLVWASVSGGQWLSTVHLSEVVLMWTDLHNFSSNVMQKHNLVKKQQQKKSNTRHFQMWHNVTTSREDAGVNALVINFYTDMFVSVLVWLIPCELICLDRSTLTRVHRWWQ